MSSKQDVIIKITELVQPILERKNFELVDVEYEKEGHQWFLRVFIDHPSGIDIDETYEVSEELSEKMDQVQPNPFVDVDFLEVSSPGIERPLKKESDYLNALGDYIHLSLYNAVDDQKFYEGELVSVNSETLILSIWEKTKVFEKEFERNNIEKARLAIKF